MVFFSCAIKKNHDDGIIIGHKTDWRGNFSFDVSKMKAFKGKFSPEKSAKLNGEVLVCD